MDLGFRHTEQIEILRLLQDEILNIQSRYLKDNVKFCPVCGNKLSKNGFEQSNFHAVFTDHKVKVPLPQFMHFSISDFIDNPFLELKIKLTYHKNATVKSNCNSAEIRESEIN